MSLLDKLENKLGRFAIPQLTVILIICQVIAFFAIQFQTGREGPEALDAGEPLAQRLLLIPARVLNGEVWRLVSFLVIPPLANIVFMFFFWYLFYLMGTALEHFWGTFRYNVYLLIGWAATVAAAFLTPDQPASNGYLQASVFLAFAFLCPDFEMYVFFLFPVKIKWLALLTWASYGLIVLFGGWSARWLVLASVCNFLLFFGRDLLERVRTGRRRMAFQAARFAVKEQPYFHRCTVCGITDRTHPRMDFRYCSKCAGAHGYCTEHLAKHEHITETAKEV